MRRGLALKFQRDFKEAVTDFTDAKKLVPNSKKDLDECDKWIRLTEDDRDHQEKLTRIMANADSLKGKEYIDYLLSFLKGNLDQEQINTTPEAGVAQKKRKLVCVNELTVEEQKKLAKVLDDNDMLYYFQVKGGLKVLCDSLYLNLNALDMLSKLLTAENLKLQDAFQRDHLYEHLIDLLQSSNQNAEGKTMDYDDMLKILQIMESGSMNEEVRTNLSDKKKIKDLFLVVIRSIDIVKNKTLVSSLT